jgi:hypothetical protein
MNKTFLSIITLMSLGLSAIAQPNITYQTKATYQSKGTNVLSNTIEAGAGWLATNQAALVTSSWTVAPYFTYAPNIAADNKVGGGILAAYAVNEFASAAVGLDWLGELSMPSGNVELHKTITPFASIGLTNLHVTPFVIGGVAVPLSGAGVDNKDLAVIYGAGLAIPITSYKDKPISVGAAWVKWDNVGEYSGEHLHFFTAIHF